MNEPQQEIEAALNWLIDHIMTFGFLWKGKRLRTAEDVVAAMKEDTEWHYPHL